MNTRESATSLLLVLTDRLQDGFSTPFDAMQIKNLVPFDPDWSRLNLRGTTILHQVVVNNIDGRFNDIIPILVQQFLNVNILDINGQTPLQYLMSQPHYSMPTANLLSHLGGNINNNAQSVTVPIPPATKTPVPSFTFNTSSTPTTVATVYKIPAPVIITPKDVDDDAFVGASASTVTVEKTHQADADVDINGDVDVDNDVDANIDVHANTDEDANADEDANTDEDASADEDANAEANFVPVVTLKMDQLNLPEEKIAYQFLEKLKQNEIKDLAENWYAVQPWWHSPTRTIEEKITLLETVIQSCATATILQKILPALFVVELFKSLPDTAAKNLLDFMEANPGYTSRVYTNQLLKYKPFLANKIQTFTLKSHGAIERTQPLQQEYRGQLVVQSSSQNTKVALNNSSVLFNKYSAQLRPNYIPQYSLQKKQ